MGKEMRKQNPKREKHRKFYNRNIDELHPSILKQSLK